MSRAEWIAFGTTLAAVACTEHVPAPLPSAQMADAPVPEPGAPDGALVPGVDAVAATWTETGAGDDATALDAADAADASDVATRLRDATVLEASTLEDATALEAGTWDGPMAQEVGATDGRPQDAILADTADAAAVDPRSTFFCALNDAGVSCDRKAQYCFQQPVYSQEARCIAKDSDSAVGYAGYDTPPQCVTAFACGCLVEAGAVQSSGSGCHCRELDDAGAILITCSPCYGSPPARLERLLRAVS